MVTPNVNIRKDNDRKFKKVLSFAIKFLTSVLLLASGFKNLNNFSRQVSFDLKFKILIGVSSLFFLKSTVFLILSALLFLFNFFDF